MKSIITTIVVLIAFIELSAQQSNILNRSTLYLKSNVNNDKLIKNVEQKKLFNFNPIITPDEFSTNTGIFKNFIAGESSLFLVFASNAKIETPIMTIACGKTKIDFSNKKVSRANDLPYKNVKAENGIILSYLFSLNTSKRNNYISFTDFLQSTDTTATDLLEVIYFPETLPDMDRKVIESFLSVKHGISLLGKVDYYNSDTAKIWDSQTNYLFNNRVTGIGRDDILGLLQKQSQNSLNDGLIIGLDNIKSLNSENTGNIQNLNCVLWGDNDKSTKFYESSAKDVAKITRTWTVQTTKNIGDTIFTQVCVKNSQLFDSYNSNDSRVLWLVSYNTPNDTLNADFIKQDSSNRYLTFFNKINFDKTNSGECFFSFIKAPEFFALINIDQAACKCQNSGDIKFRMIGGQAPFSLSINGSRFSNDIANIENGFVLKNIPAGKYRIAISDAKGRMYSDLVSIDEEKIFSANLKSKWSLNQNNSLEITPEIFKNTNSIKYQWLKNDSLVSEDTVFRASVQGNYSLIITNASGCSKEMKFEIVDEKSVKEKISIFPNPVLVSGKFKIKIDLEEKSDIEIRICDIEGKTLKVIDLKDILFHDQEEQLLVPGTYLIHVKTNSHTYTQRLIVV